MSEVRQNKGLKMIREWIYGPTPPKTEAQEKSSEEKVSESQRLLEQRAEQEEKAQEAHREWLERAKAAFAEYKPKHGQYRIRQALAGHYVIERRFVAMARNDYVDFYKAYGGLGCRTTPDGDRIEKAPIEPREWFEPVKNTNAPIATKDYGGWRVDDKWRTTGYADLAFNLFEEAEEYLQRMVKGDNESVEYDSPPLKRRVTRKAKAKAQA